MWLTSSSVGRKFIMALTGACLVLFVTFHCVMNAIAIAWPTAYNVICEFLGANWYALVASLGLALLFIIHIIWATMLTLQNRRARGSQRYLVSKPAPGVEWSSKNMYVLGIVILAFLVVHLIQFWAKMQWAEISGHEGFIPAQAGTLFLQEAFQLVWTPIVYIIGFVALWFHMNHGFWSMFQTCGWNNEIWIQRLKKIGMWWTTIVVACFVAQAIVFTVKAQEGYYRTDSALRDQYYNMVLNNSGLGNSQSVQYADFSRQVMQAYPQIAGMSEQEKQQMRLQSPGFDQALNLYTNLYRLTQYLEGKDPYAQPEKPAVDPMMQMLQEQSMQQQDGGAVDEQTEISETQTPNGSEEVEVTEETTNVE